MNDEEIEIRLNWFVICYLSCMMLWGCIILHNMIQYVMSSSKSSWYWARPRCWQNGLLLLSVEQLSVSLMRAERHNRSICGATLAGFSEMVKVQRCTIYSICLCQGPLFKRRWAKWQYPVASLKEIIFGVSCCNGKGLGTSGGGSFNFSYF